MFLIYFARGAPPFLLSPRPQNLLLFHHKAPTLPRGPVLAALSFRLRGSPPVAMAKRSPFAVCPPNPRLLRPPLPPSDPLLSPPSISTRGTYRFRSFFCPSLRLLNLPTPPPRHLLFHLAPLFLPAAFFPKLQTVSGTLPAIANFFSHYLLSCALQLLSHHPQTGLPLPPTPKRICHPLPLFPSFWPLLPVSLRLYQLELRPFFTTGL